MSTAGSRILVGDYVIVEDPIGSGGMGTVHLGRAIGPRGFSRVVAIKRAKQAIIGDGAAVDAFVREARLASRIAHANVVAMEDVVVSDDGEVLLVMEYVHGESLGRLLTAMAAKHERVPSQIAVAIAVAILHALHAAHTASDTGREHPIIHRDVSPQNILISQTGVPKLIDFGIARALGRTQLTPVGDVKGKLSYIAPEQLEGHFGAASDVYSTSVVLWEMLTGRRLFWEGPEDDRMEALLPKILYREREPPSRHADGIAPELDEIVLRGLQLSPDDRWPSAVAMASELERRVGSASATAIASWMSPYAREGLAMRDARLVDLEERTQRWSPSLRGAPEAARAPRRPKALAVSVAAVLVVGAVIALSSRRSREPMDAAIASSPISSVSPVFPSPSAAPPETTTSASSSSSSTPVAMSSSASSRRSSSPARAPTPASPRVSGPRLVGCDPPFTLDANGEKHFRPECFGLR